MSSNSNFNIASRASRALQKAEEVSKELNEALVELCGAMMRQTDTDDVSFTDDTDTVFMDPRDDSMDTSTIESIQMEDGRLVVYDDQSDEPTDLTNLMMEARMNLAVKLTNMLK
jgi:hypothetical protein